MRQIVAKNGQSIYDIALLYCGEISFAYPIAELNGLNINKTFEQNEILLIPEDKSIIATRFEQQGVNFATGIIETIPLDLPWLLSSGYWDDTANWNDVAVWND
ncbi:MAG: hypothetical protein ACK5MH_00630 [Bacteroidales bacterium]